MHATKVFEYCAREAAQILGTMATLRGIPVERMSREVRTLAFVGGTEEALLDNAVLYSMKKGISRKVDKETTMVARLLKQHIVGTKERDRRLIESNVIEYLRGTPNVRFAANTKNNFFLRSMASAWKCTVFGNVSMYFNAE
jgi:hypothetical protein